MTYRYKTNNGYEGTVQACDDDDAWNQVVALTNQAPLSLRLVKHGEVAA